MDTLAPRQITLSTVSLFSGIGGIDLGLEQARHKTVEMCEIWEPARRVLTQHFEGVLIAKDVRTYTPEMEYDLLAAGFPCVDLSHAGAQRGILGPGSGLVKHVFRIAKSTQPEWILLENVPNLLRLQRGAGIEYIIDSLVELGYAWAYRVVDSRFSGVPQRRNRVIILASRSTDPGPTLLAVDATSNDDAVQGGADEVMSGFYWTEGRRGTGFVLGSMPTLKGGSTLGIPSAPAIWRPQSELGQRIVLPTIADGEELQGFDRGWTDAARVSDERDHRWKLIGNAVTVGVAEWIGRRLSQSDNHKWELPSPLIPLDRTKPWPNAAWGSGSNAWKSSASCWPEIQHGKTLNEVVGDKISTPLSYRATKGFLSRLEESGLNVDRRLFDDLQSHLAVMRDESSLKEKELRETSEASRTGKNTGNQHIQNAKSAKAKPEVILRRTLTSLGLRYRLQRYVESDLPWRSDIVFMAAKVIVDVRGCCGQVCANRVSEPKINHGQIENSHARHQERDSRMVKELAARGWLVIVVWEHEDAESAAKYIEAAVKERRLRAERRQTA